MREDRWYVRAIRGEIEHGERMERLIEGVEEEEGKKESVGIEELEECLEVVEKENPEEEVEMTEEYLAEYLEDI